MRKYQVSVAEVRVASWRWIRRITEAWLRRKREYGQGYKYRDSAMGFRTTLRSPLSSSRSSLFFNSLFAPNLNQWCWRWDRDDLAFLIYFDPDDPLLLIIDDLTLYQDE